MRTGKLNQKGLSPRRGKSSLRKVSPRALSAGEGSGWGLPSGEGLTDFALYAGFLAPVLLDTKIAGKPAVTRTRKRAAAQAAESGLLLGGRR